MGNFILFMTQVAGELRAEGKFGTAHVYRSTLKSVSAFQNGAYLDFCQITPTWLKNFEVSLRGRGCSWNTVSTYMRVIRAVNNRAVDLCKTAYVPHLFKSVYTGTRADRKRSLEEKDMQKVFSQLPKSLNVTSGVLHSQKIFVLMFLLRGLPFVDLAYLRKSDLNGNVITYRRRKTGRSLSVTLTSEAMLLIKDCMDKDTNSPYLFSILKSNEGTEASYREYRIALRKFNHNLFILSELLGLEGKLSSYTARHTWATTAYYCEIHPGIISEAMGHSSITVTETYLKPFHSKKIDEANRIIIDFVQFSVGGIIV